MCGIFGVVRSQPTFDDLRRLRTGSIDWEQLQELASLNEMRGARSSGFLVDSGVGMRVAKFPHKKISEALYTLEDEAGSSPLRAVLCHSKAPTIGEMSEETIQPVVNDTGSMIIGHNGSILNWRSIDMTVSFDTPAILTAIRVPSTDAILRGLSRLDGQHACWLYTVGSRVIYLWRVMSPLYIQEQGDGLWFSSAVPEQDKEDWRYLPEGHLYDIQTGSLVEQGTFAYSSIY